ncbi:PadR family transcriptional regulator [Leifsonia sp. H3M29-4]|uniref:PadR family transcriptional regulator n=1 Tax=Salinibacterium metalliresistens TaxID=3031321 RepID=UPI0023D9BDAC|nr:PadR family transcriptional regulator [Salinibacterium metalliresistens]MDF1478113.1 PadR family transcriptional regulator [Salinibacterium metalliresistens]
MRTSSSAGFDLWEAVDGLREAFAPRAAGRMGRGDIRAAILVALTEKPMHGYQIIQSIEASTHGSWKPSPGSIYPTLQLLSDEGLVTAEQVGERKVYSLTEAGREAAAEFASGPEPWEPRRSWRAEHNTALPKAGAKLAQAVAQVAHSGSPEQTERAVAVIDEARRKLYAILAED